MSTVFPSSDTLEPSDVKEQAEADPSKQKAEANRINSLTLSMVQAIVEDDVAKVAEFLSQGASALFFIGPLEAELYVPINNNPQNGFSRHSTSYLKDGGYLPLDIAITNASRA